MLPAHKDTAYRLPVKPAHLQRFGALAAHTLVDSLVLVRHQSLT